MLDLRSNVGIEYNYGWLDADQAMMIACFNLLRSFVEKEKGLAGLKTHDESWFINASEWEKDNYTEQQKILREIKTLYDWWCQGRKEAYNGIDGKDRVKNDAIDNEMPVKLIKYRDYLWT